MQEIIDREKIYQKKEDELLRNKPIKAEGPFCACDGSRSHWASRKDRELAEICQRKEMTGHGPKAAMLKWLNTGSVDYEDLYMISLEMLCKERGIKYKSKETGIQLAEKLKTNDLEAALGNV